MQRSLDVKWYQTVIKSFWLERSILPQSPFFLFFSCTSIRLKFTVFLCVPPETDGSPSLCQISTLRHQPGPGRSWSTLPCKHWWGPTYPFGSWGFLICFNWAVSSLFLSSVLQISETRSTTRRWWNSMASDPTEASWRHSTCSPPALIRWLSLTF